MGSGISLAASYLVTTGLVQITTTYTNAGNSGAGACPDTYATNYPTPTIVSNWWEASVSSYSTNGQGLSASFTPTGCGNGSVTFHLTYKNSDPCDTNVQSAGDVSASFNVVDIQHQCVATTPPDQSRSTIGVGEEVDLTACGAPGTVTWSASAGTLSSTNGTSVTYTAPNGYFLGGSQNCTITVYYTGGSCQMLFTVLNPASINMVRCAIEHTYNTVLIGMQTHVYIAPDSVNFGAVSVRESSANFSGIGVYAPVSGNSHGTTVANPSTGQVVSGHGTLCQSDDECVIGGLGYYSPPPGTGIAVCSIPCQWNCNSSYWVDFHTNSDEKAISSGSSGSPANTLTISKSGASWSCSVYDPTTWFPFPT
jgi:hypothetical protein